MTSSTQHPGFLAGGRRRIDRVLDPAFTADLDKLALEDLRARREEAQGEEVDLSYARRLLQGRLDILRAEQQRRSTGTPPPPAAGTRDDVTLTADLVRMLAADDARTDAGLGRYLSVEPSRVGEHRRLAEAAVADVHASDPVGLDDDALSSAITHLVDVERRTSEDRAAVQRVVDAIAEQVGRRYSDS